MSPDLLFVGLAKLLFGLLVGVVGITLASRLLDRWLGERGSGPAIREGNLALAIVRGAGFVGLAILGRNSVLSSFAALDYLQLSGAGEWGLGGRMVLYGTLHTAVALVAGACVLGVGVLVFDRLTAGIEERRLVRSGEVARQRERRAGHDPDDQEREDRFEERDAGGRPTDPAQRSSSPGSSP